METREYTFTDRSEWNKGPWDAEPIDKRQWQDEATGLPCLIKRNDFGAWCGYVGVPEGHRCFGMEYDKADGEFTIEVHGGLTYADFCDPRETEHGICHVAAPGEPDHVWWLGFDTAHAHDRVPSMNRYMEDLPDVTYRTLDYVVGQVTSLASQLRAIGNGREE
jgi:hypothetical protein